MSYKEKVNEAIEEVKEVVEVVDDVADAAEDVVDAAENVGKKAGSLLNRIKRMFLSIIAYFKKLFTRKG